MEKNWKATAVVTCVHSLNKLSIDQIGFRAVIFAEQYGLISLNKTVIGETHFPGRAQRLSSVTDVSDAIRNSQKFRQTTPNVKH